MHKPVSSPWWRRACQAAGLAASLFSATVHAADAGRAPDDYPAYPIHIVSGFEPGGATDVVARLLAPRLAAALHTSVVVDNRPGAAGNVGAAYVARAKPDGYTLYLTSAVVAMPTLFRNLPYDVHKDFAPITLIGYGPLVMIANPNAPFKSLRDVIDYARKNPGKLAFGSGGVGSINHMAMELLISMTGIQLNHIPYKGGAPALAAVLSGEVPIAISSIPEVVGNVKSGALTPLAVTTRARSTALPNVPTFAESGAPGYDASAWYGIMVPAATPKPIQDKLVAAVVGALHDQAVHDALVKVGVVPTATGGPAEFKRYLDGEIAKWRKVIDQQHIAAQ